MDIKQKEKIKILIEKGKWNYVLKNGILFYGIPLSMILYFMDGFRFDLEMILVHLFLVAIIGGLLFGLTMWWYLNKKYNQQN